MIALTFLKRYLKIIARFDWCKSGVGRLEDFSCFPQRMKIGRVMILAELVLLK